MKAARRRLKAMSPSGHFQRHPVKSEFCAWFKALGTVLMKHAEAAARQIKFKPATQDGQPVDETAIVHITFRTRELGMKRGMEMRMWKNFCLSLTLWELPPVRRCAAQPQQTTAASLRHAGRW